MKDASLLWIGLCLSVLLFVTVVLFDLDLFEKLVFLMEKLENFEFDEAIIPFFLFSAFSLAHFQKRKRKTETEKQKAKVYIAMLSSAYHILNNFMNQMQIFKVTAQETPEFDQEVLSYYDKIMKEAQELLHNLSTISKIDEDSINESVGTKTH
ncbi:hypothetical protein [Ekhidna sp.]